MILTEPMPYAEAVAAAQRRTPVGAVLTSEEWAQVPLALRERAFWSAQQTNMVFVHKAQEGVRRIAEGKGDRATIRQGLRELAQSLGIASGDDSLTDISSDQRLGLLLDTQVDMAAGYGRRKRWQDPDLLDEWPAWELVDTNPGYEGKSGRRDWPARWADAGGTFYGKRMIALKSDPIWENLGPFQNPYPPFDYGSYWSVIEIDRDTAEAADLLSPGEAVRLDEQDYNARLEATLPAEGSEYARLLQATFGDQIAVEKGKLRWLPDVMERLYDDAVAGTDVTRTVDLGQATRHTVETIRRDLGIDVSGWRMEARPSELRHALGRHGEPGTIPGKTGEQDPAQVPLTRAEIRAIPTIWRQADRAVAADRAKSSDEPPAGWPGSIRLQSEIAGKQWIVEYYADTAAKVFGFKTAWKKA